MVETAEAIDKLDQILDTSGIDAVFVGPNDLAVSSGLAPSFRAEEPLHRRQIETVLAACQKRDITAGIFCAGAEMAIEWRKLGFRMLALDSDARLLRQAAQETLQAVRGERKPTKSKAAYA
jgi:4-hydroxy-2-oxoheptanedioate aldolase